MAPSLAAGTLLSCPDRATGRDPPARGSERLPAGAGGQARGRRRPAADLVRPARSRAPRAGPPRAPTSRPATGRTASPRSSAWIRRLRADHGEGRGGLAVHRSSDPGHWIVTFPWVGAERAADPDRGRARPRRARRLAVADRPPDRRPGAAARALDRADRRRPARRRPSGSATPTGAIPVVSISGTNGKSTVTRLITHILLRAGRHVGTTTSDGVLVDERMVDPGDWTGPGGAHQILARRDIDVAVLETARGGIVLRGVGYESNDASVLTNVSSDHLDLQGIHTLPELAEVKSTICRITKPDGWVVLNADDPLVAAVARRVRATGRAVHAARATSRPSSAAIASAAAAPTSSATASIVEANGATETADRRGRPGPDHDRRAGPPQRRQRARRRRRRARPGRHDRAGPRRAARLRARAPNARPGGSTCSASGRRVVIVDFAHNEAGVGGGPRRRRGHRRRGGRPGRADHRDHRDRRRPAGRHAARDRPDRRRARPAGRHQADPQATCAAGPPESVVGELLAGVVGGRRRRRPTCRSTTPRPRRSGPSSTARPAPAPTADGRMRARVIVLMCHEDRDGVFELLERLGARPVDVASELTELVPRLQGRPRRSVTGRVGRDRLGHRDDVGRSDIASAARRAGRRAQRHVSIEIAPTGWAATAVPDLGPVTARRVGGAGASVGQPRLQRPGIALDRSGRPIAPRSAGRPRRSSADRYRPCPTWPDHRGRRTDRPPRRSGSATDRR